ncbi:MAG: Nif3-like dinuclear metal center hexameric protein [Rikenellaceae bacterium]
MKVRDITNIIEEFAPLRLQQSYDNAGLTVGSYESEVTGVLLAVDVTQEVIDEALRLGVNLIITHHPIIFSPLKRLTSSNYVECCVQRAIQHSINLYASHTNLDGVRGGMSWFLGEKLQLRDMQPLEGFVGCDVGFGVVGELETPMPTLEYIRWVGRELGCSVVRTSDIVSQTCARVAICTGSGGSLMEYASRANVDLYITADLKYNDFMTPSTRFTVVDVGHYESEYCVIDLIFDILSKKMINFAIHKSESTRNPIHYLSL